MHQLLYATTHTNFLSLSVYFFLFFVSIYLTIVQSCGIDKKEQQHIFDKFYQADKTRASSGNGLGLALVKQIITLCGGTVAVESVIGKGSTFTVKLPKTK